MSNRRGHEEQPAQRKEVACVSCVSATFFQPVRSGSHLYTANRNTLRSGHRELDLLALVGTPLWGCRSLTLYLDYITLKVICQAFFLEILDLA